MLLDQPPLKKPRITGDIVIIHVQTISGQAVGTFRMELDNTVHELCCKLADLQPIPPDTIAQLCLGTSLLCLDDTFRQHALSHELRVSCVFASVSREQQEKVVSKIAEELPLSLVEKAVWNTMTQLHVNARLYPLLHPFIGFPPRLRTLEFGCEFNDKLDNVALPSGLQTLTFDYAFNQSLDKVALPNGLQTLTFGYAFNRSLDKVALPSGLQTLTFGYEFNQSLDKVALPSGLQTLTFGCHFNHNLDKVTLPSGLQTLTFGRQFNHSLDKVALPSRCELFVPGPCTQQYTPLLDVVHGRVPRPGKSAVMR